MASWWLSSVFFSWILILIPASVSVCLAVCQSDVQTPTWLPTFPSGSQYLSIHLSSCSSPLPPHCTWTEKRLRFFSWEPLGKVCCSVSKQWQRNPVFPGPVSLPAPWSYPGPASCQDSQAELGNSRLISFSRIQKFWLYTSLMPHFTLSSFFSLCFARLFFLTLFFYLIFVPCNSYSREIRPQQPTHLN